MSSDLVKNLARIMVRRYLREWVNYGYYTEDEIVQVFWDEALQHPDAKLAIIAGITDRRLREMVNEGTRPEAMTYTEVTSADEE